MHKPTVEHIYKAFDLNNIYDSIDNDNAKLNTLIENRADCIILLRVQKMVSAHELFIA